MFEPAILLPFTGQLIIKPKVYFILYFDSILGGVFFICLHYTADELRGIGLNLVDISIIRLKKPKERVV